MDDPKLVPSSHHDSSSSSSLPLIARLDHLEFIMKYLERKQRCGGNVVSVTSERQSSSSCSSDLPIKEAPYFKGTLTDRVASLEQRLFQLCVEMDSSGSSNPLISRASTQANSGESSSSHGSKGEIYYSFPTFNTLPNNKDKEITDQNHNNTLALKENSECVEQQTKNSCAPPKLAKQHVVVVNNNRSKKEKKQHKGEKKGEKKALPSISWPHLKLLGC